MRTIRLNVVEIREKTLTGFRIISGGDEEQDSGESWSRGGLRRNNTSANEHELKKRTDSPVTCKRGQSVVAVVGTMLLC